MSTLGGQTDWSIDDRDLPDEEGSPLLSTGEAKENQYEGIARYVTKGRIKSAMFTLIFITVVILFARNAEQPLKAESLMAVTNQSPYIYTFSQPRSFVSINIVAQQLEKAVYDHNATTIIVNVESGSLCPPMNTSHACSKTLFLTSDSDTHAEILFALDSSVVSVLTLSTPSSIPVALSLSIDELGALVGYQVGIAAAILIFVYALIVLELVHRTLAAMFGSFLALAVLSNLHTRPSFREILTWIDWDTCGLLFGMMVMVGIFSTTGFFEYSAVRMYKLSKGNLWHLVVMLCAFTAVVSAFLDNVTTILLLTPVTIRLCRVLDVDPIPILLALVVFSNVGGTATAIGDPPNIIIVSDARIKAMGGVTFGSFALHMIPGVILSLFVTFGVVRFWFKSRIDRKPHQAKLLELEIWQNTARRLVGQTEEELLVLAQLKEHIEELKEQISDNENNNEIQEINIEELENKYKIRDWGLFVNSSIILSGCVLLFFLESFVHINLNLAWIALIGAIMLMLVAGVKDLESVLHHVEWGTLMFFAALFILMEALDRMGLIGFIGEQTSQLILTVPAGGNGRLATAVTLIIWVSGVASAFIDNIPFTTAMIPVVLALTQEPLNLPLTPLIWSLSFGACFGGNGTLIGASANVVCAGLAESEGYDISFNRFFRRGFPVMLITLATANVYMLCTHVWFGWY